MEARLGKMGAEAECHRVDHEFIIAVCLMGDDSTNGG
jgi:hypothetical protein